MELFLWRTRWHTLFVKVVGELDIVVLYYSVARHVLLYDILESVFELEEGVEIFVDFGQVLPLKCVRKWLSASTLKGPPSGGREYVFRSALEGSPRSKDPVARITIRVPNLFFWANRQL